MKVTINRDECIGCGACVSMCPDVFSLDEENKAVVSNVEGSNCDLKAVAESCPVGVINVEE